MLSPAAAARRALPAVDRLLKLRPVEALVARYGRLLVTEVIREVLDSHRKRLADENAPPFDEPAFVADCAALIERRMRPSLRPVFNLSGTVLHTNLGRAVMPGSAARAVAEAMTRPVNLEFDLDGGGRGERDSHVERWLQRLTGA